MTDEQAGAAADDPKPGDVDRFGDFGDELESPELAGLTWYVYRPYPAGEPRPVGVGARSLGVFRLKRDNWTPDLGELAEAVGPGLWRLVGKTGGTIRYNRTIEIFGKPWPIEQSGPMPPTTPAVPSTPVDRAPVPVSYSPAAGLTMHDVARVVRDELSALGLARPPSTPAFDPSAIFLQAFTLAKDMVRPQTPTDPGIVLNSVVEAFRSGIDLGKIANPEAAPAKDTTADLVTALAPVLAQLLQQRAQAPAPAAAHPAPTTAEESPPRASAAARPAADPIPTNPSQRAAIAVAELIARGIAGEKPADDVADAVDLLIDDADQAALGRMQLADVRAWLGPVLALYPAFTAPNADRWLEGFLACYRADTAAAEIPVPAVET